METALVDHIFSFVAKKQQCTTLRATSRARNTYAVLKHLPDVLYDHALERHALKGRSGVHFEIIDSWGAHFASIPQSIKSLQSRWRHHA